MSKYTSLVNSILESTADYKRTYKQEADLVVIHHGRYMDMLEEEGYPEGVHLPPYTPYHPSVSLSKALGVKIILRDDFEAYYTYVFSCQEKDIAYLVGKSACYGVDTINTLVGKSDIPPLYSASADTPIKAPDLYKQAFPIKSVEAYHQYKKRVHELEYLHLNNL